MCDVVLTASVTLEGIDQMTVQKTRDAIKALPAMTALRLDREWRVTIRLDCVRTRYPNCSAEWCEHKQEAMACYTNDAEDALGTARAMSEHWQAGAPATPAS